MDIHTVKSDILRQIEEKNQTYKKFADLINSHALLYEANRQLQICNKQLSENVDKLKLENNELSSRPQKAGVAVDRSEQVLILEQKLYRVQEELTEVHRTKGTRAQQIIDLNIALQEKEKEVAQSSKILKRKEEEVEVLNEKVDNLEQRIEELLQANQTLKDEYQALHITSESIEQKLRCLQVENQDLVERWLRYKNRDANVMNSENDTERKKKEENLSSAIKDALNENKTVSGKTVTEATPTPTVKSDTEVTQPQPGPPPTFKQKFANFFLGTSQREEDIPPPAMTTSRVDLTSHVYVQLPQSTVCTWKAHESEVTATRFSSSGGILATGGSDKLVHIWNFVGETNRLQHTLRGSNGGITSIDFDLEEQVIAASSNDYATRLWSIGTQRLKLTLTGHAGKVLASRFLGTSYRLASGSNDRTVKVWDVRSGACTRTFMAGSSCNDIVSGDNLDCLMSGHFDRKIRVWDARAGSQVRNEISVGGRVTSLDMPADKSLLVCSTKDHTLELIDLRKFAVLKVFEDDAFKVATDQARCAFSPDGEYVSAGSSDGSVLTWNVKTGDLECCVKEHKDPVISCNWRGGRLITGDKNKTCSLWAGASPLTDD